MSLPNIPNITPCINLNRQESIDLLLSSIAMEEIGLSHILNAEGEKIQKSLNIQHTDLSDLILINESVNATLKNIIKSQVLLQLKLEEITHLQKFHQEKEQHNKSKTNCTCSKKLNKCLRTKDCK